MTLEELLRDYALIKKSTLTDIGDAIREKTGGTEAIATNAMAAAIASIAVGGGDNPSIGGLINGFKYDCGTFSLAADQSSEHTQEHKAIENPIAIFVWTDNAPVVGDDGKQLRYRYGGYWMNTQCDASGRSGAMLIVNGATAMGPGANTGRNRITIKSATNFSVGCDDTYPLRGGLVYHWIIMGG